MLTALEDERAAHDVTRGKVEEVKIRRRTGVLYVYHSAGCPFHDILILRPVIGDNQSVSASVQS